MTPLLDRLHRAVQDNFARTHDNLRMEAIAASTALYRRAAKCWPEVGYDHGEAEDNLVSLFEAHEILTTAWRCDIHRAIIRVAEACPKDAAFLYFMLGFAVAGYRDHLK
jgi:hypothetical protein